MRTLARKMTALPPLAQDAALSVSLTVINLAAIAPDRAALRPLWPAVALVVAQTLPLMVRRRWPVGTFLAVGLSRLAYDLSGLGHAPAPFGPAFAYFTVIERCGPRARRAVTAVLVAGSALAQLQPGHNQPYDLTVVALTFLTAGMAGVLSRTRSAYTAEVEARAERAELDRDAEVARSAAAERARIARELHDVVAHHVSLMAVQAEAAGSLLPARPEEAGRAVDVIAATARAALTELRRLLGVLRGPGQTPQTAPAVSLSGLDSVLRQVREAGLPVEISVTGPVCALDPGTDLTAYRIIQEALTNTLRHARADRAEVALAYEPGFLTVSVTDVAAPGRCGVPAPRPAEAPGGFGLAGIVERVASCGGSVSVGPAGTGFAVTARLPAP